MRYEAELSQLPQILDTAVIELIKLGLSPEQSEKLRLALEEAVVNVMRYAYPEKKEKPFELNVKKEGNLLLIELKDWGVPFDPLSYYKKVDVTASLEELPIGGLGIFFIKKMVDEMRYRYHENCNELTLIKKL